MYDSKNERHEFIAGNRDDAVRKATDYFGVDVAELEVGEFPEGAVYGLGGRSVIVASLRDRKVPAPGRSGGGGLVLDYDARATARRATNPGNRTFDCRNAL